MKLEFGFSTLDRVPASPMRDGMEDRQHHLHVDRKLLVLGKGIGRMLAGEFHTCNKDR
jgi:hypothetical protein